MMGPVPHADELDLITDLALDDQVRCFVEDLRSRYAFGPPPQTEARLATILASGLSGGVAPDQHPAAVPHPVERRSLRPLTDRLQSRRLRLGLGAAVAGLTIFGTGAAGALPGPVQPAFERAVKVVGIELPEAARTPPAVPAPAEGAPRVPPSGGSGADRPSPPLAEPGSGGPTESGPPDTAPASPHGDGPGEATTGDAPGRPTGEDGRPGLSGDERRGGAGTPAEGFPAPGSPGPSDRPGSGPPPGVPGPGDGDDDEEPEESERPGLPGGSPGATGLGSSEPGQAPANGLVGSRGRR